MTIQAIMAKQTLGASAQPSFQEKSFKDILHSKMAEQKVSPEHDPSASLSIRDGINHVIQEHELNKTTIKKALMASDHSPENMLKIQYKTGVFFLREQMLCKVVELSANSLKNFTQMNI